MLLVGDSDWGSFSHTENGLVAMFPPEYQMKNARSSKRALCMSSYCPQQRLFTESMDHGKSKLTSCTRIAKSTIMACNISRRNP